MADHRIQLEKMAEHLSRQLLDCGEDCDDLWWSAVSFIARLFYLLGSENNEFAKNILYIACPFIHLLRRLATRRQVREAEKHFCEEKLLIWIINKICTKKCLPRNCPSARISLTDQAIWRQFYVGKLRDKQIPRRYCLAVHWTSNTSYCCEGNNSTFTSMFSSTGFPK